MRLALLPLLAALIPAAIWAQQPADSSLRGDTVLANTTHTDDDLEPYRTGARFSDLLVVRGERVGLRVSPGVGPLGLVGGVRFRGPQTFIDDRLPLVILDGMRLDAASGVLGGTARLEDINPEDVEVIEVLSPAAAVRFGPGAANGVVIVRTREGHRGSPQWRGHVEVGTRTPSAAWPAMLGGFDADNPDSLLRNGGCTLRAVAAGSCVQDSVAALPAQLSRQFQTAVRQRYGLSVTGGWQPLSYYVEGEWDGDGSVLSLSQAEIDRLKSVGASVPGSVRTPQRFGETHLNAMIRVRPTQNVSIGLHGLHVSQSGRFPAFFNDQPTGLLYDLQTGYMAPGDAFQIQTLGEASRWLGNLDVTWAATRALSFTGNIGHDGARVKSNRRGSTGVLSESAAFNSAYLGVGADYDWQLARLQLRSHLGFERSRINRDSVECVSGTSPNCTSGAYRVSEVKYWQRFWSLVFEQRAVIDQSLELVATIRRDDFQFWRDHPIHAGLHASWRRDALRLRADYGSAGRRAFLFEKPERTREISTGFDVTARSGRVSLGGTIYDMKSNVFAPVGVSGSSGFFVQVFPATIGNRGIELNARAQIIERGNLTLKVEATAWGNRNRLLSTSPIALVIAGASQQRSLVGSPVGGFWAWRPLAYADANGNGIIEPSEISGSVDVVWAGSPYPTQGATLAPELGLRTIRMGASLDYQAGHVVFNRAHWWECLDGRCPWAVDRGTPLAEQADVVYGRPTPRYFEDGDFLALRELWITMEAPPRVAGALHMKSASITLVARNLHTWTGYSGISPEPVAAETPFGDPEAFTEPLMPALQQWSLRVRLSY